MRGEPCGGSLSDRRSRTGLLLGLFVGVVSLVCASGALAAGRPVNIGTPFEAGQPAVAVTSAGDAVIAWANTKDLSPVTTNIVQYCVMAVGAGSCLHSGNLVPADSGSNIDGVQVLSEGSTLVILADVYGTAGDASQDYVPEQEWQSTDGGATWIIVNGGLSVTSGILSADTGPLSAVTLPGTGVLGYGWESAGGPPTFNAFPLSSPPECSVATCAAGFATLEPATNPDTVGNGGGQYASQTGVNPGVMGIFFTDFSNGPLGCSQGFGSAYAYGSGAESAANDYNISPGSANSAWKVALAQADCNVEYQAVAGGPSGFGVLETNDATGTVAYQRFDQSTLKFDTPLVTIDSGHGELDPALSQDATGGVYATYLFGGGGGPINLSYSADGGHTWATNVLNADADEGIGDVNSSVSGRGQGWATWQDNGSVYAQSFQATDAVAPAAVSGGASSNGQTVNLNVSCASFPCTITITLTAPETVVVHAASVPSKKGKTKRKTLKLGSGKFTLKSGGAKKLAVKLSSAAKKLLKSRNAHFKITAEIAETVQRKTTVTTKTLTLTIKPPKKSRK
jgi:hypothetical protein